MVVAVLLREKQREQSRWHATGRKRGVKFSCRPRGFRFAQRYLRQFRNNTVDAVSKNDIVESLHENLGEERGKGRKKDPPN